MFNLLLSFLYKYLSKIIVLSQPLVEWVSVNSVKKINNIFFFLPTNLSRWRAETIYTKEPGTIKWIKSFKKNEIFWDIGANVGIYSLYAASLKKVKVYSFEPSPNNFYVLCKNIYLNKYSDIIIPFCICLSKLSSVDKLYYSNFSEGSAHNFFGNQKNEFGETVKTTYSQDCLGFKADDLVKIFKLKFPNHLKLDVDGSEINVILGATRIIKNKNLKSILVEFTSKKNNKKTKVFKYFEKLGFTLASKEHPDGEKKLTNFIFRRKK